MANDSSSALSEATQDLLKSKGWKLGPEFWQRYHADAWVFNLCNLIEQMETERAEMVEALAKEGVVWDDPDPFASNVPVERYR